MNTQTKYENLEIIGKRIFINRETQDVSFPEDTTEKEIEVISWYLFEEGFLKLD
jgi:hypothetical protein|tara:strand:+ start:510 stop:671 length:162 start_codon:yes stop_codon:yes gene_type:complete